MNWLFVETMRQRQRRLLPVVRRHSSRSSDSAVTRWLLLLLAVLSALLQFQMLSYYVTSSSEESSSATARLPPLSVNGCSCFNTLANARCCQRKLLVLHKSGHVAMRQLFRRMIRNGVLELKSSVGVQQQQRDFRDNSTITTNATSTAIVDYRHVVPIRNTFDAMVSGYLYHRSGHECWKTLSGKSFNATRTLRNGTVTTVVSGGGTKQHLDWEARLTNTAFYPPRNNRSICQYLADESEYDGMRVLMDWLLSTLYGKLIPYYAQLAAREAQSKQHKTLFFCFHLFSKNTTQQRKLYYTIADFLFPGGLKRFAEMPNMTTTAIHEARAGHATTNDTSNRQRLYRIAQELDETIFHHTTRNVQSLFQCNSSIVNE